MKTETARIKIDGVFWDEVYKKDAQGREYLAEVTKPEHNRQMNLSLTIIAGLLANDVGFTGGVLKHAQGSGSAGWDSGPIPEPPTNSTTLVAEVGRKTPDSIVYLASTHATRAGGAPSLPPANLSTLLVAIDGDAPQTVTFDGTETTPTLLANKITAQLADATGVVNGANVDIVADSLGVLSTVEITGGSGLVAIGHTVGTSSGTDTPTGTRGPIIRIRTTYEFLELVGQTIREQGLFCGTATATANSGLVLNIIRQAGRFKSGGVKLVRNVKLTLSNS